MSKVVFIDEQDFDTYEDENYSDYEGFSTLDVYDIPDYDDYEFDYYADNRSDYEVVGDVYVGFNEGDGEVLAVDGDFRAYDVEFCYPSL